METIAGASQLLAKECPPVFNARSVGAMPGATSHTWMDAAGLAHIYIYIFINTCMHTYIHTYIHMYCKCYKYMHERGREREREREIYIYIY